MGGNRSGDGHCIDRRILDEFPAIPRCLDGWETVAQQFEPVCAQIRDASNLRPCRFEAIANQIRPPVAIANDSDSNQSASQKLMICWRAAIYRGTARPSRAGTPFAIC